ncbi:tyrosine-type recombinase/integrase [Planctomycetota bacterium]
MKRKAKSKSSNGPGCIYLNSGRYWLKARLPGESKTKYIPLKPTGARYATKDPGVAKQIADELFQQAQFKAKPQADDSTIAGLIQAYMEHARSYYRKSNEANNIEYGLRLLSELYSDIQVEDFTPLLLEKIQQKMINQKLKRNTVNKRIGMIKRMFNWAMSRGRAPSSVAYAVSQFPSLKQGRSEAVETEAVKPVPIDFVYQVLPYASPTIAAMMEIQLLTGMRSSELCNLRPIDIDPSKDVWLYSPTDPETGEPEHKTAHLGIEKSIAIGPKAQKVLNPYMNRKVDSYCFSPEEVVQKMREERYQKRKTPLHYGRAAGDNKKDKPQIIPGEKYTKDTYRRAFQRAIKRAEESGEKVVWFTPHQLRHTAATLIRKEFGANGLEYASAALGHRDINTTQLYAELQRSKAIEAARKLG